MTAEPEPNPEPPSSPPAPAKANGSPCCKAVIVVRATEIISKVRFYANPTVTAHAYVRSYCAACGNVLQPANVRASVLEQQRADDERIEAARASAARAIADRRSGTAADLGFPAWRNLGVIVAIHPFADDVLWEDFASPRYSRPDLLKAKIAELLRIPPSGRASRAIEARAIGTCHVDMGTVGHLLDDERRKTDVNHLRMIPAIDVHLGDPIEIWLHPPNPPEYPSPSYAIMTAYQVGDRICSHLTVVLKNDRRNWVLTSYAPSSIAYLESKRFGTPIYARYCR